MKLAKNQFINIQTTKFLFFFYPYEYHNGYNYEMGWAERSSVHGFSQRNTSTSLCQNYQLSCSCPLHGPLPRTCHACRYHWLLPFLIHMSNTIIDLCSELCLSGRLAVMRSKNFNIGHYMQTFQPNFFHTCHTNFSDLDLGWVPKVSAKQNLLVSFSLSQTLFTWTGENLMWCKQFKLSSLILLLSETWWNEGNECYFTDCVPQKLRKPCW